MRILLGHKYFHLGSGNDKYFFETGRVLEKHGHTVAWFASHHEQNFPSQYSEYFVQPPRHRDASIFRRTLDLPKVVYSYEAKQKFGRLIGDFKPDVVHLFGIFTQISPSILDACASAHLPAFLSCNDYKMICTNYRLYHHGRICEDCKGGRHFHAVLNRCCHDSMLYSIAGSIEAYAHQWMGIYRKNVHTYLFASEFMARKHVEHWGENNFRWRILRNPFDLSEFTATKEHRGYCLFFGSLMEIKGVHVLIHAMSKLGRHIQLLVVGDGPEAEALRRQAASLGCDHVQFAGAKWGRELVEILEGARFVIVPSVWHENFPYVALQAFAAGKAVIGSDRGGIPELVRNEEFGLTYPADDAEALATCIARLWDNPLLATQMGLAARTHVEREFSDDRFYEELMNIYEDAL